MMPTIKELIRSQYPTLQEMPFCSALHEGRFGRSEILRAEIAELYRALDTRGKIQDIYKRKLRAARSDGNMSVEEVAHIESIIDDEGETEEHIDHLDMRFKLFAGTSVSRKTPLRSDRGLQAINDEWIRICDESDLLTLMGLTAGIEEWYAPLSAFFEEQYRKRGFSDSELELFIVHKAADLDHSEAQFDVLDRNKHRLEEEKLVATVKRTFATSRAYDIAKLRLAETDCELSKFVEIA